ncbi:MAG: phospholipase D family protein, partial [Pseudomonadota bacterium]|nr:phospholipase D family protein [Pseudomonadota bacterium]
GVQRPVSQARADVAETRLATIAAAPGGTEPGLSGFRLLPVGDQAFDARIALARRAEKTLDVQYYLIAADGTGLLFLRELRDAAARGVRVRVMVDDLHGAGQDALYAGLAAHPNVEVRLWNPLPVRSGSFGSRLVRSVHEFSRINRRMHNKLFIADNVFAVTGGRNMADEYFDRSEPANFIDMDMLASGPVVPELSEVFDLYWNSEHAYPVQSLVGPRLDLADARRAFDAAVQGVAAAVLPAERDSLGQRSVEAQLASGVGAGHFAAARVLADAPSKADAASTDPDDRSEGTVTTGSFDLIGSARADVLVASPYFIPGQRGLDVMRAAVAKNVRVSVMTNSLSTTDAPLVHFVYARYRTALLKMGVALYELMPLAGHEAQARRSESAFDFAGSLGRLHAKLAVVDERYLFIGSMNMDRRSARWNTEIGLVIDSPELAGEVTRLLQRDRLPSSYRLRLAGDTDRIEWVANTGGNEVVRKTEPDSTAVRQLRLWLTSRFVAEDLL